MAHSEAMFDLLIHVLTTSSLHCISTGFWGVFLFCFLKLRSSPQKVTSHSTWKFKQSCVFLKKLRPKKHHHLSYLPIYLHFHMIFIPSQWSKFLSGIISLQLEELNLALLGVYVWWWWTFTVSFTEMLCSWRIFFSCYRILAFVLYIF